MKKAILSFVILLLAASFAFGDSFHYPPTITLSRGLPKAPRPFAVVYGSKGSTSVTYFVTAVKKGFESSPQSVTVTDAPATRTSVNSVGIFWTPQADADSYRVYESSSTSPPTSGSNLLCSVTGTVCYDTGQALQLGFPPPSPPQDNVSFGPFETLPDAGAQVFNVKAYGAKGDGVTNDSSAFQAAFNAAQPAGGLVWIPGCGPYYVPTVPTNISTVSFNSPGYTCANKFVMQPPFDSNDIYYNYNTITSTDNLSGTSHSVEGWVFDINQMPSLPTVRDLAVGADLSVLTATGTPPSNNSPTLTGNFDGMFAAVQSGGAAWNSVGVMGIGDCITSSGNCWGANFIAGDSASLASQPPNEYALELNNTPSNAASLYSSADAFNALRISLLNTHMPTGGAGAIGNAINIVSNGASGYGWNTAFSSGDGASLNGIYLGLAYGTGPVASQNIALKSSGGTGSIWLDSGGAWIVNMPSSDVKFAHTGTDLSLDLQNNSGTTWHLDSLSSKDLSIFSDAGTGKVTLNGWNFAASGSPGISAGTISISASTSGSYTFTTAYTTAPICTATQTSGTVISPTISATTTSVTVTVGTSGTYGFNFICVPAAN